MKKFRDLLSWPMKSALIMIFFTKSNMPEVNDTSDVGGSKILYLILPWLNTTIPFFSIAQGLVASMRGNDVEFVYDNTLFGNDRFAQRWIVFWLNIVMLLVSTRYVVHRPESLPAVLDDEGSTEEVTGSTVLAGAPTLMGDNVASTLWWDGFTIAANVSDADAEATFVALVNGISDDVVRANNDAAVWLSDAYKPSAASAGVSATAMSGASPYPMLPYMGLLHGALGAETTEFLQGSETAAQALADVEAAYTAAAKEKGFLQ